jgi:F0F1-type ATP synthase membrane subunit b/b'
MAKKKKMTKKAKAKVSAKVGASRAKARKTVTSAKRTAGKSTITKPTRGGRP